MAGDGWTLKRFNHCADLIRDTVRPSDVSGLPYIGLEHIAEGQLTLTGFGSAEQVTSIKSRFRKGDILFGKLRPYFRKVVIAPFDGVCSTDIWVVRQKQGIDQRYLFYWMASNEFIEESTRASEGTRMPRAQWEFVGRIEKSVPPLKEQCAIAHILGTLDDKIELNRRMNQTLEEMARSIFKSWFVDFDPVRAKAAVRREHPDWSNAQVSRAACPKLKPEIAELFPDEFENSELGEIPKGWRVKSIGSIIERLAVGKKYEQKTVKPTGNVPVLDQGKTGIIGYHDDEPGVVASKEKPVAVFANHTCYMRLVYFPFSAIQNVLPFVGQDVDTIWAYFATLGKQSFIEYKGHWPDFIIHKVVVPNSMMTVEFSRLVHPLLKIVEWPP